MGRWWISILLFALAPSCWAKLPLQYAVKFVCGRSNGAVVLPGEYLTAINIHNPSDEREVRFLNFEV